MAVKVSGVHFIGNGTPKPGVPRKSCSSLLSPEPRQRQHATDPIIPYYFSFSLHMGPPRSHRRGKKAVLPCMFDSFSSFEATCLSGRFGMVTDGVNVLPVRSRTTRSSKGKASLISSLFFRFLFLSLVISSFHIPLRISPNPHLSPTTCLPVPLLSPSLTLYFFFRPLISSSRTQKSTRNSSRNSSVSSDSTRPTQPATEIAFFARSQISCMAQSLATSSSARISVIGFSHTASAMPPSSTTSAAWTSTFPSCANLVSPPPSFVLFSIIGLLTSSAHTPLRNFQPHMAAISNSPRSRI